jgi:hypothetical protein
MSTQTTTFNSLVTGASQTYTVPAHLIGGTVGVDAIGGLGGNSSGGSWFANGGRPAEVIATLPTTPSATLTVYVAQQLNDHTYGYHLGGAGPTDYYYHSGSIVAYPNPAGAGGGSSAVLSGGTVLVEAGGGGGAGGFSPGNGALNTPSSGNGGNAGTSPAAGSSGNDSTAGTTAAGGAAATISGNGSAGGAATSSAQGGASGGGGGGGTLSGQGGTVMANLFGDNVSGGGGGAGSSFTAATATGVTVLTNVVAVNPSVTFTARVADAPNAPTLTGPANAAVIDTNAVGVTFTWTYNPGTDSGSQNAYALAIQQDSGAYQYWNAGTSSLGGSIVWNTSSSGSVVIPAAKLADGHTYNWKVATQESFYSLQGPFSSPDSITAVAQPTVTITAPTGTIATATPTVTWTDSLTSSSTQTSYRVVVYTLAATLAGGFVPGSTVGTVDTGVVASASTSVALTGGNALPQGSWVVYVQIVESAGPTSPWASSAFTISFPPPATPSLTATPGVSAAGVPILTVAVSAHDNLLSAVDAAPVDATHGTWTLTNATVQSNTSWLTWHVTSAGTASSQTNGAYPVVAGTQYTAMALVLDNSHPFTIGIIWKNSGGGTISTSSSSAVSISARTQITVTANAPSGAVSADVIITGTSMGSGDTTTQIGQVGIFPAPVPVNLLSTDDSTFASSVGTWAAISDANAPTRTSLSGAEVLVLSVLPADTGFPFQVGTGQYAVSPSTQYTATLAVKAATTARNITLTVIWYNSVGTNVGSMNSGASADNSSTFTTYTVSGTSPSTAAFAVVAVSVGGAPVTGEDHYVQAGVLFAQGSGYTWTQGGLVGTELATVMRSLNGGITWAPVRNGVLLTVVAATNQAVVVDYEAPFGVPVLYQATISCPITVPTAGFITSLPNECTGEVAFGQWMLTDPLDTTIAMPFARLGTSGTSGYNTSTYSQAASTNLQVPISLELDSGEDAGVFFGWGNPLPIVQRGTIHTPSFVTAAYLQGYANYAIWKSLTGRDGTVPPRQHVLLMRSDMGDAWYVVVGPALADQILRSPDRVTNPKYLITIPCIVTAAP